MEAIVIHCQNGHKFKAREQHIGKAVLCPHCRDRVQVKMRVPTKSPASPNAAKDPLSESGVMRILGDMDPLPAPRPPHRPELQRACPRCSIQLPATASVCKNCQCYVGSAPDFLRKLSGEAG